MSDALLHVIAQVRLLSPEEGGRNAPIIGSYRPNHNFFDLDDAEMTVGVIELPDGVIVQPGEAVEVPIAFWWWPGLTDQVYAGREWHIQEGHKLVAIGRVITVESTPPEEQH